MVQKVISSHHEWNTIEGREFVVSESMTIHKRRIDGFDEKLAISVNGRNK
jgi:hypothetical protein